VCRKCAVGRDGQGKDIEARLVYTEVELKGFLKGIEPGER